MYATLDVCKRKKEKKKEGMKNLPASTKEVEYKVKDTYVHVAQCQPWLNNPVLV